MSYFPATKVNELEVSFGMPVDTADVTLTVAKDTAATAIAAPVWNATKTVATITTTAKMTNGTYTVSATSTADKTVATADVEITSQKVSEIIILNETALTGKVSNVTGAEAYVYYDVLDQYGESLRTSTSVQWSSSVDIDSDNRADGKLTISRSDDKAFSYNEMVYITGVYAKTGASVTSTVTVGQEQAFDAIEFKGFVKKGTSEIVTVLPAGFSVGSYYMVYNVTDQNGNPMVATAPATSNDVTFIVDNVLVINSFDESSETVLTVDGVEYNAILVKPGMSVNKGGEVNITAIANKTGNKTELNTVIGEEQILTSFTILSPTSLIADGEDVVVPFEALDQNGNAITNFVTLAMNETFNKLSFTTSEGTLVLYENDDATATLKYTDDTMAWTNSESTDGQDRTISLTSVVVGGDTSGQLLYISDKARPEAISAVSVDSVLVELGSDSVAQTDIDFLDQYGRKMDDDDATAFFAASEADQLLGTDFLDYTFSVRATFTGDSLFLTGTNVLGSDAMVSGDEYEILNGEPLTITALGDTLTSSKSGFGVKYEIVKYAEHAGTPETFADDAQAISPAKNTSLTVVDVAAVKSFVISDLSKFFVETDNSDLDTGDLLTITDAATYTAPVIADSIAGDYEQSVTVKGTFNGTTVTVPGHYYFVSSNELQDTGITTFDATNVNFDLTDGDDVIDQPIAGAILWSDLYDATSARYVRKDLNDVVKASVYGYDAVGNEYLIDTTSIAITISDEAVKADSIVTNDDEWVLDPTTTDMASVATYLADQDDVDADKEYTVLDQYGVEFASNETLRVTAVVENAAGYAENNFTVAQNATATTSLSGAERGDTFSIVITAGDVTKTVTVVVGADASANITESTNNYLDVLIGGPTDGALEQQRLDGLN